MLVTGGAVGADQYFEKLSRELGHKVTVYNTSTCRDLTDEQIVHLDKILVYINDKYLHRTYPTTNNYTNNLLRRNILVALASDVLYAVGYISDGKIEGGTAWCCYTFMERSLPLYFYNQHDKSWYNLGPPKIKDISGIYGGIGSRNLTEDGINAIKMLYS